MRIPRRLAVLIVVPAFTLGGADIANSETPQYCRDLAIQFGSDPAQMDGNALAALGGCVMNEMQQRSGAAPAAQPSDYQPPPPQQGWGQWPQAAPWADEGAKSQSWGDHINE